MLRTNQELLALLPDMLQILIATARLAHIERILPGIRHPGGIITVVADDTAEDRIPDNISLNQNKNGGQRKSLPHPLVHIHRNLIPLPHIQIDKPRIVPIRPALQPLGQPARVPKSPERRGHSQYGDVAVPGCVVLGLAHSGGLFFELAHDCFSGGVVSFAGYWIVVMSIGWAYCSRQCFRCVPGLR